MRSEVDRIVEARQPFCGADRATQRQHEMEKVQGVTTEVDFQCPASSFTNFS